MPKRPDRSASSYLYRRLPRIPSFLHPILIESDGKGFFVRGKLQRENRVSFIARRSFVYSYCWYSRFHWHFYGGWMLRCTMAFGKGKREMSEIINYKIRKGYSGIPCNISTSILF